MQRGFYQQNWNTEMTEMTEMTDSTDTTESKHTKFLAASVLHDDRDTLTKNAVIFGGVGRLGVPNTSVHKIRVIRIAQHPRHPRCIN